MQYSASAGTILLRTGGTFLILAAVFAAHSWNWARHRTRAEATIVENVAAFAPGGGVVYSPRIRFRTGDGELVELLSGPPREDADFQPGETVPVLYPATEAREAIIATKWRLYFWAICFAIAGTVFFDTGLVVRRL